VKDTHAIKLALDQAETGHFHAFWLLLVCPPFTRLLIFLAHSNLFTLDAWGHCKRRHGGGASTVCDYAMAMNILEFLDAPHPMPARLSDRYVAPFFYTKRDPAPPKKERSSHTFRINRIFT
jgi:hypothetical protein